MAITPAITIDNTLGAVLVGFAVSCIVYGILLTQVFVYFSRFPLDRPFKKGLVILILVLDTSGQAVIGHIVYFFTITNFNNRAALRFSGVTWSFILQQTLGAIMSTIVKLSFTMRVWRFSQRNYWITGAIITLVLGHLGLAMAFTFKAFELPTVFRVVELRTLGTVALGVGVLTDLVIAASLCYFLLKLRTGYHQSDTLVNSLVRYAINTGLLTGAVSTATLILYNLMPENLIFIATYFVLNKLYAISYMATTNTRRNVKGKGTDRQGTTSNHTNMFHLGTRMPSMGPQELEQWDAKDTRFEMAYLPPLPRSQAFRYENA